MFSLLRKVFGDSRDTEQLLYDIAEYNRRADYAELYRRLIDVTLYLPVDGGSLPENTPPGRQFQVSSHDDVRMSTVTIPDLGTCIPVATQATAEILRNGYVGIHWREFLIMAQTCNVAGVLIEGKSSWVAFDMERIRYLQNRSGA